MITVFGSINVDLVCRVRKSPLPGETVLGSDYQLIPGGKGANQALAARRAGARSAWSARSATTTSARSRSPNSSPAGVDLDRSSPGGAAPPASPSSPSTTTARTPSSSRPAPMPRPMPAQIPAGSLGAGDTLLLQMEVPQAEVFAAARRARGGGRARGAVGRALLAARRRSELADIDIVIVNEHEATDFARHLRPRRRRRRGDGGGARRAGSAAR